MGKSLTAILATAAAGVLVEEARAMLPWLSQKTLSFAVNLLPHDHRERYMEEWSSHLTDVPGPISKLVFTLWLSPAALRIRLYIWSESKRTPQRQPYAGLYRLALLMLVALVIKYRLRKALEWLGLSRPRTKILGIDYEVFVAVIIVAIICLCGTQTPLSGE